MPEPRIWILPQEVSERIAAGEVVERPSSVVKELVENALDAGARRVTVETEAGGKALIRVTDDGQGMSAEEAWLALQRHGTSKLRTADDLFNIHTLGFRGEALPSIAAVSELQILTRTPGATEGTRLVVEGGVLRTQEAAAAQVGTAITVQRLFFNVPVREKFLRSATTESNQITDWLQRLALSRPDVSFRLTHDGREALLSPGSQDALNAVVAVLGRAVARDMLRVGEGASEDVSGIRVSGFVGRPTLTRANRALQHTYVNGRAVRSPLFYRAIDDAYRATMPQGRHPVAVLFIQVPPDAVDVNVHPAKTEVRFRDEPSVHGALLQAVRAALRMDADRYPTTPSLPADPPEPGDEYRSSSRIAEPGSPAPAEPLPFADAAIGGPQPWSPHPRGPASAGPGAREPSYRWTGTPEPPAGRRGDDPPDTPRAPGEPAAGSPAPGADAERYPAAPAIGELTLLGQAQDLFILAAGAGRLWVIDQHVAHERVLFDRMTATDRMREPAEPLLLPPNLEVDRGQALALEEHRELLGELGFVVEPFGRGRYLLRSVPRSLVGRNYESVFRDLADELAEQSQGWQVRLRREEVAMVAAGR
ncbi:MAG TPA: DNA mismatch repair endonuclease MutL, partial [Armatimonadota bacterium]|nr:DNA mismatch repair endonuclease MutL [Armatimonadota bacterium]